MNHLSTAQFPSATVSGKRFIPINDDEDDDEDL